MLVVLWGNVFVNGTAYLHSSEIKILLGLEDYENLGKIVMKIVNTSNRRLLNMLQVLQGNVFVVGYCIFACMLNPKYKSFKLVS